MGISSIIGNRSKEFDNKFIKIFIILAFVFSVLSAIIVPPNQVPDEIAHFVRSYDISNGNLIPGKNNVVMPTVFEQLQLHKRLYTPSDQLKLFSLQDNPEKIGEYLSTSNYPFIAYLPQSLGIALGRLFHLPPMGIFLLGRIFNALVCAVGIFLVTKIIPGKKWLLLMLSCTPMALYLAGSYSPDGVTNIVAFFFISIVFAFARKNGVLTKRQVTLLVIAAWLLALCKINIVPLALLLLIIPYQRFGRKRNKYFFLFGCFLLITTTLAVWNSISPITPGGVAEGVMPTRQALNVILNPFTFMETLANTFGERWFFYLDSWFGKFGWLDASMPQLALLLYLGVLVYLAGSQDNQFALSSQEKWVVAITFVISVAITFLILYMVWTKYEADLILGVQGRYLIPFMPLLFLLIPPFLNFLHHLDRYKGVIALITSLLIWTIALVVLVLRFYVPCGLSYLHDVDCALPAEKWQNIWMLDPLVEGASISQTIVPECDQMYQIDVYVSTLDRVNNSTLQITLRETESQEVIKEFVTDNQTIQDQRIILVFDPIPNSRGQTYDLHFVSGADENNAVSLISAQGEQYPAGQLFMDGQAQGGDLQFNYYCHVGIQSIQ